MDPFYALADPTRRQIVETLAKGEYSFGDIADQFLMSRPAVSQHLKVLREAGIVVARRDAQRRIYRLQENGLAELDDWLAGVKGFWNRRLDKLADVLGEDD